MILFEFYRFKIKKSNELPSLIDLMEEGNEDKPHYDDPYDCFSSFFKKGVKAPIEVQVTCPDGTHEMEPFGNDILKKEEGIIVLTLENNRVKHTTEDKQDKVHPRHPYCHVIIDNRPDRHYIIIERNSAFREDEVAKILCEAVNAHKFLGQYRYIFSMDILKKSKAELWQMIDYIRDNFHDTVRQVRLDFVGDQKDPEADTIVELIRSMAEKTETNASLLLASCDADKEIKLDAIREDLIRISKLCLSHPNYGLLVKFKTFGVYKYGASMLAQFGIDEKVLNSFAYVSEQLKDNHQDYLFDMDDICPPSSSDDTMTLPEWLERMHSILESYESVPVAKPKRQRRRRKSV